ncbi:hypothetical protein JXA05_00105, partial [Candidatus Peregrinibacteria bacterium]|nr:hypothetical protein [Candidatus Peregrinibacteria bacterium]
DKVDQRLDKVDQRLDKVDQRLDKVDQRLDTLEVGVRHNGVLIEKIQSDIGLLVESNQAFHSRVSRLEMAVFD